MWKLRLSTSGEAGAKGFGVSGSARGVTEGLGASGFGL